MPSSQLKRLKASLREQGITGPRPSKKQKKSQTASGNGHVPQRVHQNLALQQIRDDFNPFDVVASNGGRPEKFASASYASGASGKYKAILHRPGASKSAGEAMRRAALLPQLRRRNKVGGVIDRRIGEGDTDMTPEERAAMRFAKENERKRKGAAVFDLEASDEEAGFTFTHGGQKIHDLAVDDFDDESKDGTPSDGSDSGELLARKRPRGVAEAADTTSAHEHEDSEEQPEMKRTKKEVMQEVIAKSKLHKYERQKAKEADDELREELDAGMGDILALLKNGNRPLPPRAVTGPASTNDGHFINPERQKLLESKDRHQLDKEYDLRLKQLAQDTRAKPSNRTKTTEEKAADDASRLQVLEERRLRRMRGEDTDEELEDKENSNAVEREFPGSQEGPMDEAANFGFVSSSILAKEQSENLIPDDEDVFLLDEDMIASGSDAGLSELESMTDSDTEDSTFSQDHQAWKAKEEEEFVQTILGADAAAVSMKERTNPVGEKSGVDDTGLKFTYPCPRTHDELLAIVCELPVEQVVTVIRRIRALYHPSLAASNKEAMAEFSCVLVHHLAYMAEKHNSIPVAEHIIRHIHSLSRTYPSQIGTTFRNYLSAMRERDQVMPQDLMILTAIGSIYPSSDHWHQIITPAISLMARWLSLNAPSVDVDADSKSLATGGFLVHLCLRYQTLSKRYLPDAIRFVHRVLLSATRSHASTDVAMHVENLLAMADLWRDKSAFQQIFSPFLSLLGSLHLRKPHARLTLLLARARTVNRPLELHHHRPVSIRSAVPKFEEAFNPEKHYDPDKERSDARKLQKEYKRERKGALRELRKDANFIAREQLREKRIRDEEYEKKYRRLVAEVQNEEGAAAKEYERERGRRHKKK